MSEDPLESSPVRLDYARANDPEEKRRSFGRGIGIGVATALFGVPSVAGGGYVLDTTINPNAPYVGLNGLFFGGLTGIGLAVVGGIVALVIGWRKNRSWLRGFGLGLLISVGFGALAVGLCIAKM